MEREFTMEAEKISILVEAAQKGDKNAFEELYFATNNLGYFLAYNITHDEEAAKDILQDSYINAFTNIKSLKSSESFQKWFNIIVVNGSKNYIVKNKPGLFLEYDKHIDAEFEDEMMSDDFIPEKALDNKEVQNMLKEIIDNLPDDQRLCILMYYYQQIDVKGISKQLGIAEGTVRSRLYYGRQYIKKRVEALEKGGIKLYGAAPVPVTIWALQGGEGSILAPEIATAIYSSIASSVIPVAAGAAATIGTKLLMVGIGAVIIITGSCFGINYLLNNQPPLENPQPTVQETVITTQPPETEKPTQTATTEATEPAAETTTEETVPTVEETQPLQLQNQITTEVPVQYTQSEESTIQPTEAKKTTFNYIISENKIIITKYTGNETDVVIPKYIDGMTVSELGEKAFADNKFITSVEVPDSINEIKDGLFSGCYALKKVALPETIERIGIYAFSYCDNLDEVNIPNSVKEIGYCAFLDCTTIKEITIPKNTESIGINAFANTPNLTLQCYKDSYAQEYAEKYSLQYNIK